jgi:hypothetical protein
LETVREFECALCGAEDGTVVAAHSNQLRDGKGKGIKASDAAIAALCYSCHFKIDQGSGIAQNERLKLWSLLIKNNPPFN